MAQQTVPKAGDQEILGHWIWAVPILLVVAALSLRQIDLYPPTADEFFSMFNSRLDRQQPVFADRRTAIA